MRQARLVAARTLSPSVRELTFDPGPDFKFLPGQWVSLRTGNGHDAPPRAYSIASAPRADRSFDVAVTRVPEGPGSNFLHQVEPGAVLAMSEAQGFFTLPAVERPLVMVATGTGVSPFRSMLEALAVTGTAYRVWLLFGARTEQDLIYLDEFRALHRSIEGFRYIPTLSRGNASWDGRRGYVQLHVPELVHQLGAECDVFICGLSKMVKDVRRILKEELGLPRERIHTERYD